MWWSWPSTPWVRDRKHYTLLLNTEVDIVIHRQRPMYLLTTLVCALALWIVMIVGWSMGWMEMQFMTHWGLLLLAIYLSTRVVGWFYYPVDYLAVLYFLPPILAAVSVILVGIHYIIFNTKTNLCSYASDAGEIMIMNFAEHYLTWTVLLILTAIEAGRIRKMFFIFNYTAGPWVRLLTYLWQCFGFLLFFGIYMAVFDYREVYAVDISPATMTIPVVITGVGVIIVFWIMIFHGYYTRRVVVHKRSIMLPKV